jgi:hypothetical protein
VPRVLRMPLGSERRGCRRERVIFAGHYWLSASARERFRAGPSLDATFGTIEATCRLVAGEGRSLTTIQRKLTNAASSGQGRNMMLKTRRV